MSWSHVGATCDPTGEREWLYAAPASWNSQRVAWLARHWGLVSEHAEWVPQPVGLTEGGITLLAGSEGAAYVPSPDGLQQLAPLLGRLDRALRMCDLQLAVSPKSIWVDREGNVWLFGLTGLRRALGAPGIPHAEATLRALGGAEADCDWAQVLESWRAQVWPHSLSAWRDLTTLEQLAPQTSERHPRTEPVLACFPDSAGGLVVLDHAVPNLSDEVESRWWAVEPSLDRLVVLTQPMHADLDLDSVRVRREAFRAAHPTARTGPALDARLAESLSPELRHDEPFALLPPPRMRRVPQPLAVTESPLLRVAKHPTDPGAAELTVSGLPDNASAVVVVRCGEHDPIVPADGVVVAEVPIESFPFTDPEPAERYAAFPLIDGLAAPPGLAAFWGGPEISALDVEPGIGSILLRWDAPADAIVEVLAGGALAHSDQGPGEWTHDCLDAGQSVDYLVRVSLTGGSSSPGAKARAVALGPPPALGPVVAKGLDRQVELSWSWPAEPGYELVRIEREPPFEEGLRTLRRGAEPQLVDLEVDPGVEYRYTLRTAWGKTASIHSEEASATPSAELQEVRAEAGGEAVYLSWSLPRGADPAEARVLVVRNAERAPNDLQDGESLEVSGSSHLDAGLPVGEEVHYRVALRLGQICSPGVVVAATPRASAGRLGPAELEGGRGSLQLTFTPPAERCEQVLVFAGSDGMPLQAIEVSASESEGRLGARLDATPGVLTRVRLVPSFEGQPDHGQAVELTATAWDDLSDLNAPARANSIELRWAPPSASPTGYAISRTQVGKEADPQTWTLPGDADRFLDESVTSRLTYRYTVSCLWSGESSTQEAHEVEVSALAEPPELPKAELRVEPGSISLRYLPVAASARLHCSGAAVFSSPLSVSELEERFALEPVFDRDNASALGLTEIAVRSRSKRKEVVRCDPPEPGTLVTFLLASLNDRLARPVLIAPGLGLPESVAELSATKTATGIHLTWTFPSWIGKTARISKLVLERGLDEIPSGLTGEDLEELSAPNPRELPPTTTEFEDTEALGFLAWGYRLNVSLEVGGHAFSFDGPRVVVRPTQGGTLRLSAIQPRGLFGSKGRVELSVDCEASQWPAFEIRRSIGNQQAGKVVAEFAGGAPQASFLDEDLGNFSSGTRLRYQLCLLRERDKLGFESSESALELS